MAWERASSSELYSVLVCDYFVASAGALLPGCLAVVHHQAAQVAPPFPVAALRALDLCEGLLLVRRCCSASDRKHLVAAIAVMAREQGRDPLGILLRLRRGRENPKPNRQHPGPVHSDLPGAALVREEDDIVVAFIDVVQQAEEDVHGLTHLRRITLL